MRSLVRSILREASRQAVVDMIADIDGALQKLCKISRFVYHKRSRLGEINGKTKSNGVLCSPRSMLCTGNLQHVASGDEIGRAGSAGTVYFLYTVRMDPGFCPDPSAFVRSTADAGTSV